MTSTVLSHQRRSVDPHAVRRAELSAFLRSRRERISPAEAGLPLSGRRRTPGLRREEVAQIAGVGVTWYTWLEQGRDIRVSEQVLEAIARTLRLDRDERTHLFTLAGSPEVNPAEQSATVSAAALATMHQLAPFPACIQNGKYDLLAYNRTYGRLVDDIGAVPVENRNCMYLMFTDPRWRERMVDWEVGAARMVAQFRAQLAEHVAEPAWKAVRRRMLTASPEFADLWQRHEVSAVVTKEKQVDNPYVGRLRFEPLSTWLDPRPGTRMVVYVPADELTRSRLQDLHTRFAAGDAGEQPTSYSPRAAR